MLNYTSVQLKTSHQISFHLTYPANSWMVSILFLLHRQCEWGNCSTHLYSPCFVADSISRKYHRMINHAFLPIFLFNPFNLEMTRVTIINSNTNMCGSFCYNPYIPCVANKYHNVALVQIRSGVSTGEGRGTIDLSECLNCTAFQTVKR